MNTNPKIIEFEKTVRQLNKLITSFPTNKRTMVLFDKWSAQDIIAHLNNWIIHDIKCLNCLKANQEPCWEPDIDVFNSKGVRERQPNNWEEIHQEFKSLSNSLIQEYKELDDKYWNRPIWKNRQLTPATFIIEDITHWNQHMKDIEAQLTLGNKEQ